MWQDYVFTTGIVVFNLSLIPAIRSKSKPPFITAAPTAFFQYVFLVAFGSLHMWLSVIGTAGLAIQWTILAVQAYGLKRAKK